MNTKLSETEEWELIVLARQGERWATAKLVEQYANLVKSVVRSFVRKGVLNFIGLDDLMQDGFLGLLDAIARYEQKGARFSTYAVSRIDGAVVDALRQLNPTDRVLMRQVRKAEEVRERLAHTLLREPTNTEWRAALPEELREGFEEIRVAGLMKRGHIHSADDREEGLGDSLFPPANEGRGVDDEMIVAEEQELARQRCQTLQGALGTLSGHDRWLISVGFGQALDDDIHHRVRFRMTPSRARELEAVLETLREQLCS